MVGIEGCGGGMCCEYWSSVSRLLESACMKSCGIGRGCVAQELLLGKVKVSAMRKTCHWTVIGGWSGLSELEVRGLIEYGSWLVLRGAWARGSVPGCIVSKIVAAWYMFWSSG